MAGPRQILRARMWIYSDKNGSGSICSGNPGCYAFARIDRDGERSTKVRSVIGYLSGQV